MTRPLTGVSLFAGIGGFDLAMQRAGISVRAAVEIDPRCRQVLARHFPGTTLHEDVTEVSAGELRAAGFVPRRGVVCAGWPCQGNSVAGRRGGMGDPRSGLWAHVVRILAATRARWFIGENVPGLLDVGDGHDFAAVLGALDDLGYGVAWRVLDAQWFGVAQRRRRVFLVGCLGDGTSPVSVLLEPEGGSRDSAAGSEAWAGAAVGARGSTDGASVGSLTAEHARNPDAEGAAAGHVIASTLQAGVTSGWRVDAEGAAGNHLVVGSQPVPVALRGRPGGNTPEAGEAGDPAFTLRTPGGGGSRPLVAHTLTAREGKGSDGNATSDLISAPAPEVLHAERHRDGNGPGGRAPSHPGTVHAITAEGADASEDGSGRGTPSGAVPMALNPQTGGTRGRLGYAPTPTAIAASQITGVHAGRVIRRLTPTECERLQGFPDGWTAGQSDAARYRQLGNAVAVPVAAWITTRLAAHHEQENP